jgi:SRSO17 transposase
MVATSPPVLAPQTQPDDNVGPTRFRSIARVEKNLRLPIWPVQNGVIMTILDLIGKCNKRLCTCTLPRGQYCANIHVAYDNRIKIIGNVVGAQMWWPSLSDDYKS